MSIKTIRLILGDQLNASHSWYKTKNYDVLYVIAEMYQEATYVKHHVQKICAFFAAMQAFASALDKAGHNVLHIKLDEERSQLPLNDLIALLCGHYQANYFEYQRPDEFRLSSQLESIKLNHTEISMVETEHFILPFKELERYFTKGKSTRMEIFYRKMRQRFNVLMNNGAPIGDQWNFDADNRNKLKKTDIPNIPEALIFENDIKDILARIDARGVEYFGEMGETLLWPVTRKQALELLDYFCAEGLPQFGRFQDSMTADSPDAWSLYHSRLSFAINAKILSPMQVINRAIQEYECNTHSISLAQIEGFVRQIIGWREFIRGIYWANMPDYSELNELDAKNDLPSYFWNGETKMRCMQKSLGQSLEYSYAHHIQRLMVIGNFCLLAGIDPDQVDEWYLGVYIDAIEWVEMPNTRGMCQFADGGLVASKPYTASGSYINRMSDYCKGCHYAVKEKIGDEACPFNSLYWHFMQRHKDKFGRNPRIGMVYRNLEKMDNSLRDKTLDRAEWVLNNLDHL
jgi:deoxyribodipyrimidine photolyase-related protein